MPINWDDHRLRGKRSCRCGHSQRSHHRHDGLGGCGWKTCTCTDFQSRLMNPDYTVTTLPASKLLEMEDRLG